MIPVFGEDPSGRNYLDFDHFLEGHLVVAFQRNSQDWHRQFLSSNKIPSNYDQQRFHGVTKGPLCTG